MKKPVDFFHRRLRFLLHRLVVPPFSGIALMSSGIKITGAFLTKKI